MTRIARGASQLKWRRRRQEATRRRPILNLVPLMDVFTILVFFFLVHSADSGSESLRDLVKLPESVADQQPRDTPVITITTDNILLAGESVIAVASAMAASGPGIDALRQALQAQAPSQVARTSAETGSSSEAGTGVEAEGAAGAGSEEVTHSPEREITIMGDRTIPYALLGKVMRTCTDAGFGSISLSVLQRSTGAG